MMPSIEFNCRPPAWPAVRRPQNPAIIGFYLVSVVIMFALKRFYSTASPEQLLWILQPLARMVSLLDRMPYAWEAGIGYVRADMRMIIAPACAGINFMIMAFGLSVAAFLHRHPSFPQRLKWLMVSFGGAYAAALVVNTIRIVIAVQLYEMQWHCGWITPMRLHRITGVAVYFIGLGLYYTVCHRIISAPRGKKPPAWLPWVWYVSGTVAVPLVHLTVLKHPGPGMEYCLTVAAVSLFVWGLRCAGYQIVRWICRPCGSTFKMR